MSGRPSATACPRPCPSGSIVTGSSASRSSFRARTWAPTWSAPVRIDRVAAAAQARRRVEGWAYCLDFNGRCPNVEYVLDCLREVRARAPEGFARILCVEQPTARDLRAHRESVMHEAARPRPVVVDESLTDLESLRLAREMGYNGVALKACKGQSQAVLMAAAAQTFGLFLCVQDLTCPGAPLIHSIGISAHVPTVAGIEVNARQYVPAANERWAARFPGIFRVVDGYVRPREILGPGLGSPTSSYPRSETGEAPCARVEGRFWPRAAPSWRRRGPRRPSADPERRDSCQLRKQSQRPAPAFLLQRAQRFG